MSSLGKPDGWAINHKNGVFSVKSCIVLLITIMFSACSTQPANLDSFVDKDIQDVIAAYGEPRLAFPMEENRRDFQWVISSSNIPAYPISQGVLVAPEKQIEPVGDALVITPMFNNAPITSECIYTLKTHWDSDSKRWIVTGYQKPLDGCE